MNYTLRRYPIEIIESIEKEEKSELKKAKFSKKQREILSKLFRSRRIDSILDL